MGEVTANTSTFRLVKPKEPRTELRLWRPPALPGSPNWQYQMKAWAQRQLLWVRMGFSMFAWSTCMEDSLRSYIFTHPSIGCRAIARGFSRFCHKSTFLWVPSKFATSIRDVPESVQYNLSWIQSTASPPISRGEWSTKLNQEQDVLRKKVLFPSQPQKRPNSTLLSPPLSAKVNSKATPISHSFHSTHPLAQGDALHFECWVPTFLHWPTLFHHG